MDPVYVIVASLGNESHQNPDEGGLINVGLP
jgi:hypothetical protein